MAFEEEFARADAEMRRGRYDEACKHFERVLSRDADNVAALLGSGVTRLEGGLIKTAIRRFRAATQVEQTNSEAWRLLGRSYMAADEIDRGIAAYRAAITHDPDHFVARQDLAKHHIEAGDPASADEHFEACVQLMERELAESRYDQALLMENAIYTTFVRPIESDEHADKSFARWAEAMTAAGEKARDGLPCRAVSTTGRPVVGFFLHTGAVLAHSEVVLGVVEGLGPRETAPIEPRLYVFGECGSALKEHCRRLDLALVVVAESWPGPADQALPFQRLMWLRRRLADDRVDALVWVTSPAFLLFAAAFRLAPVQIWWAMRFRGVSSPHIDGRMAIGSCFQRHAEILGRSWRVGPLTVPDPSGRPDERAVAELRSKYERYDVILATLARTEKMNSDTYLEAVAEILRRHPKAVFLWTGFERHPRIARYWDDAGVGERCIYVGWVDTQVYARAIDVFLDTAPAGCGVTAMQAMMAGKPIVAFAAPFTMWGENVMPLFDGDVDDPEARAEVEAIFTRAAPLDLLLRAATPGEYADIATRVIADRGLADAAGAAGRAFCVRFLNDTKRSAAIYSDHILAIVAAAAAGAGSR